MLLIAPLVMAAALAVNTNDSTTGYTQSIPVHIAACTVQPEVIEYPFYGDNASFDSPEIVGNSLNIKFSNSTNKLIKSVTFAVADAGNPARRVVDSGKFSPETTISHSFASPVSNTADLRCGVSSVTFSDGSMWVRSLNAATAMK